MLPTQIVSPGSLGSKSQGQPRWGSSRRDGGGVWLEQSAGFLAHVASHTQNTPSVWWEERPRLSHAPGACCQLLTMANKPATENNYAHLSGAFISLHPMLTNEKRLPLQETRTLRSRQRTRSPWRAGPALAGRVISLLPKTHVGTCCARGLALPFARLRCMRRLLTTGAAFLWKRSCVPGHNPS